MEIEIMIMEEIPEAEATTEPIAATIKTFTMTTITAAMATMKTDTITATIPVTTIVIEEPCAPLKQTARKTNKTLPAGG